MVKNVETMTPRLFGAKVMRFLVFVILTINRVSGSQLHGVCMGRSGTSAHAGGFGNLGDPVVPTVRGVSGDVVTTYAY